jgi:GTP cyclohydrolase I
LKETLGTEDVAVIIDANHMCVASRGVNDVNSSTITSSFNGKFLNEATKSELLKYIYSK